MCSRGLSKSAKRNCKIAKTFWITAAEDGRLDALTWLRSAHHCPWNKEIRSLVLKGGARGGHFSVLQLAILKQLEKDISLLPAICKIEWLPWDQGT